MQCQDVADFIKACSDQKIPVDFVSTHYYPTDPQCQTSTTKGDNDCFADQVLGAQSHAAEAKLPFFITGKSCCLPRVSLVPLSSNGKRS